MSFEERTGERNLAWSRAHRPSAMKPVLEQDLFAAIADLRERQIAATRAAGFCTMIDLDCLEYCAVCREPLALGEVKHVAATTKTTTVLERLAARALLPAYLIEYRTDKSGVLSELWVSQRFPETGERRPMTVAEYYRFVLGLHESCHWEAPR